MVKRLYSGCALRALLVVTCFTVAFFGTTRFAVEHAASRYRTYVGEIVPESFPVYIRYRIDADGPWDSAIIYHRELSRFIRRYPVHEFQIPEGQVARSRDGAVIINRPKEGIHDNALRDALTEGEVRIEAIDGRSQRLLVDSTHDSDWILRGWYIASTDRIKPLEYQAYFGPGLVLRLAPYSLCSALFITSVCVSITLLWRRVMRSTRLAIR